MRKTGTFNSWLDITCFSVCLHKSGAGVPSWSNRKTFNWTQSSILKWRFCCSLRPSFLNSLKFNFVLGYAINRLAKMTTLIAILMAWKRNDNNAKNKDSRVWIRSIILYCFHFYFTDGKAQTPPIFLEMTWKLNVLWALNRYHWKTRAKYHRELLWKCARGHRVTGGTALCEMSILRSDDSQ